jgi:hypothetical protein
MALTAAITGTIANAATPIAAPAANATAPSAPIAPVAAAAAGMIAGPSAIPAAIRPWKPPQVGEFGPQRGDFDVGVRRISGDLRVGQRLEGGLDPLLERVGEPAAGLLARLRGLRLRVPGTLVYAVGDAAADPVGERLAGGRAQIVADLARLPAGLRDHTVPEVQRTRTDVDEHFANGCASCHRGAPPDLTKSVGPPCACCTGGGRVAG